MPKATVCSDMEQGDTAPPGRPGIGPYNIGCLPPENMHVPPKLKTGLKNVNKRIEKGKEAIVCGSNSRFKSEWALLSTILLAEGGNLSLTYLHKMA